MRNWGSKPFKFFKCWFNHEGFLPFIEEVWNSLEIRGKPGFVLKEKLYLLKNKIKLLNKEVLGIVDLEVNNSISSLRALDSLVANVEGGFIEEVVKARRVASKAVWEEVLKRESILNQKYRSKWILEGDSNSKFFHNFMKSRFRRNSILGLQTLRGRVEEVDDIKSEVCSHFYLRFMEPVGNIPVLDGVLFNCLSNMDRLILEAPFFY